PMPSRGVVLGGLLALSLTACNPYERRQGEYYAGAVDPSKFPAAYLGAGGVANRASSGTFEPVAAHAGGQELVYYSFPMPASQADLDDPLLIREELAPPNAFVFDPAATSPFPAMRKCSPPKDYQFDQQQEGFRQDEQGSIFTLLPSDPAYVPLVEQVAI